MNILIAVNEAYLEPAKTMLYSLACQQSEHLVVYLLQSSIRREKLDELSEFVMRKCHGELQVVQIDKALFTGAPKMKWLSEETYYRLISFEVLPLSVDRVLWLDADIIIKGNITEFYQQNFDEKYAVVCAKGAFEHHQRLNLSPTHRYFNAGVILYDLNAMRSSFTVSDVFACIEKHKDNLKAMDQDVLNIMFEDRVKYAEADVYNYGVFGFCIQPSSEMKNLKDRAKVIHFLGAKKPWDYKGINWADKYWWQYELARGGRFLVWLRYRIMNMPVKLKCILGEVYYLIVGQLKKVRK